MAAAAKSHRYISVGARLSSSEFSDHQFEFDEADVWTSGDANQTETRKSVNSNPRPLRKPVRRSSSGAIGARSLPVNIPDWSKILRSEYRERAGGDCMDDYYEGEEGDEDGNDQMPPHEYLARTRVASLSVHEGIGRTLKGRDLSRVRNAIWKKTGFED